MAQAGAWGRRGWGTGEPEDEDPDGSWAGQGLVMCLWPPSPAEGLAPCAPSFADEPRPFRERGMMEGVVVGKSSDLSPGDPIR